nr:Chain A, ATWLPPR peptide [unidentified]
ATWLPPR